jgi:putative hydrolase of the HAD superfamily
MKLPAMILFDYGHTLIAEPNFSSINGTRAVMEHTLRNPLGLSVEDVEEATLEIYRIHALGRDIGLELPHRAAQRLLYEYLQLELDISGCELELAYWEGASPCSAMPRVAEMLECVKSKGIRVGVVSNISFSGEALERRIHQVLPDFKPEFAIASSEYMVRKPNRLIFDLALSKARLSPDDVWHCGDSHSKDLAGANSAGIFPVWYKDQTLNNPFADKIEALPDFEHLLINDWLEMIEILNGL